MGITLPKYALYVAIRKKKFKKVFSGIASALLRYEGVQPGDFIEISMTVTKMGEKEKI